MNCYMLVVDEFLSRYVNLIGNNPCHDPAKPERLLLRISFQIICPDLLIHCDLWIVFRIPSCRRSHAILFGTAEGLLHAILTAKLRFLNGFAVFRSAYT